MLQDLKTSEAATQLFLTDKYLPGKCLTMAFERTQPALSELSDWRATLIANSLLLEVTQVRSAFKKFKAKLDQQREAAREFEVCGSADPEH